MRERLDLIVCIKQVLDPEAAQRTLRIDEDLNRVTARGAAPVLDPYSTHALWAALVLRDQLADSVEVSVTAIGVGSAPSKNLYLKALAAGADRVLLLDESPPSFSDSWWTASRLATLVGAVVDRQDRFLVICGRRASDTDAGAVGPALAELLAVPVVTLVKGIKVGQEPGTLSLRRVGGDGTQQVLVRMPAVVTVSHEMGELPYVEFARVVEAKSKPFDVIKSLPEPSQTVDGSDEASALVSGTSNLRDDVDHPSASVLSLEFPADQRACAMVEAPDAREAGRELARMLSD